MSEKLLVEAAISYHNEEYGSPKDWKPIELTERQHANNIHAAFKAGAEWQKEQYNPLIEALQSIANWPGNLRDEQLLTKTGPNDAAYRGNMVVGMRAIAIEALKNLNHDK